jgi:hypothetical protein
LNLRAGLSPATICARSRFRSAEEQTLSEKSNALGKNLPAALQSFNRLFAGDDELLEFDLKESLDFNCRGMGISTDSSGANAREFSPSHKWNKIIARKIGSFIGAEAQ